MYKFIYISLDNESNKGEMIEKYLLKTLRILKCTLKKIILLLLFSFIGQCKVLLNLI